MLISSKSCTLLPSGFPPIRHQGAQDIECTSTDKVHTSNTQTGQNINQAKENSLSNIQNSISETNNPRKDNPKYEGNQLHGSDRNLSNCSKSDNCSQKGLSSEQNSHLVDFVGKADFVDNPATYQSNLTTQEPVKQAVIENTEPGRGSKISIEDFLWDEDFVASVKTKAEHSPKGISSLLPRILARWSGLGDSGAIYEGNLIVVSLSNTFRNQLLEFHGI